MANLPLWVVRILTVALTTWVREQGGVGNIEDAAVYFGVSAGDIRAAIGLTQGVLEIRGDDAVVGHQPMHQL